MHRKPIDRPNCEQAHAFTVFMCGDPTCGLHLVPERRDGTPICEMVIGRPAIQGLLDTIHDEGLDV